MKKKLTAVLCLAVLLTTMLMPAVSFAKKSNHGYYYISCSNRANLRSSTLTRCNNRIGWVYNGTEVLVYEWLENKTWAYVQAKCDDGVTRKGYVQTRVLSKNKPAVKPTPVPGQDPGTFKRVNEYFMYVRPFVPGSFIYLRTGPDKSYSYISKCYENTEVIVMAEGKGWYQVRVADTGYVGYMMSSALVYKY